MYNQQSNTENAAHACGHAYRKQMGGHFGRYGKHFGGFSKVPVNISETATDYTIEISAPGFSKEVIKISAAEDMLTITAGNKDENAAAAKTYTYKEFPVGYFKREFLLNGKVDTENISAKYEDAVLRVTLPKTAEAQKPAQEIKVS